jgi:hypothetical protein
MELESGTEIISQFHFFAYDLLLYAFDLRSVIVTSLWVILQFPALCNSFVIVETGLSNPISIHAVSD